MAIYVVAVIALVRSIGEVITTEINRFLDSADCESLSLYCTTCSL
jgi:hypothetical protein